MPPKKATTAATKKAAGSAHGSYRGMFPLIFHHHHIA